jgi:ubiquinone/menaquinone biosynthesis C-methylase UbiE
MLGERPSPISLKGEWQRKLNEWGPIDNWLKARAEQLMNETKIIDYLKDGGRYLDIGAGKGHIMETLEKNSQGKKFNFLGVDNKDYPTKKVQSRIAQDKEKNKVQNFSFAKGEELPFKDKKFDGVTMFFTLHEVDDATQKIMLAEAKRIIGDEPEHYIMIAEDIVDSKPHEAIAQTQHRTLNITGRQRLYFNNDKAYREMFDEAGLEVVNIENWKSKVNHAFYVLRKKHENKSEIKE